MSGRYGTDPGPPMIGWWPVGPGRPGAAWYCARTRAAIGWFGGGQPAFAPIPSRTFTRDLENRVRGIGR